MGRTSYEKILIFTYGNSDHIMELKLFFLSHGFHFLPEFYFMLLHVPNILTCMKVFFVEIKTKKKKKVEKCECRINDQIGRAHV